MHKEDLDLMKSFDDILEKDFRKEIKRIIEVGTINPTDVSTVTNALCLMLKSLEFEEKIKEKEYSESSYAHAPRNYATGRYMSRAMDPYAMEYPMSYGMPMSSYDRASYESGYSGHSTKDRMVARLEDMMGEAKNDYERNMIKETIASIQSNS